MRPRIEIKELAETKLIGITHIGEFEKIPQVYDRLMKWAFEKDLLKSSDIKNLTIYHDNPRITETSKVRWSACLVVNVDVTTDDEIRNLCIRKGLYSVGHFEIEPRMFEQAWEDVLRWVKSEGCLFDDREYFEIYHHNSEKNIKNRIVVDICVPIVKPKNMKPFGFYIQLYKEQLQVENIQKAYKGIIGYMMNLRTCFKNKYSDNFYVGNFYQGCMDITYFTLTPEKLKNRKLKIGIGLNHEKMQFGVWLGAQNRQIQREYWKLFKGSDWNRYDIPSVLDESFAIVEYTLVENPDFDNLNMLTDEIEHKALRFIDDILDAID